MRNRPGFMVSPILADVLCRSSKASTADKGSFCEVPGLAQTPCSSGTPDNAFSPFFPLQSKDARALLKLLNFGINWGFFFSCLSANEGPGFHFVTSSSAAHQEKEPELRQLCRFWQPQGCRPEKMVPEKDRDLWAAWTAAHATTGWQSGSGELWLGGKNCDILRMGRV